MVLVAVKPNGVFKKTTTHAARSVWEGTRARARVGVCREIKIIHPTRARNAGLSTDAGACRNIPCMSKQYYTEASAASPGTKTRGKMRGKMRFGRTVRDSGIGHSVRVSYCLPIVVISTDFETAIENLQRRGKRPRKTHLYYVTTLLLFIISSVLHEKSMRQTAPARS